MTDAAPPLRITFLSWRDTTHPDGGGSERYLEEIAQRLAARGHAVTVHCARHRGSLADEVVRGIHIRRRGGRLTVYLRGLLFLAAGRGRGEDVVVDIANGIPFAAGMVRRRGNVVLIHHTHLEQWKLIYPGLVGRAGWLIESRFTPWLYRRTRHVTVSQSTKSDLSLLGIAPDLITVIRNSVATPLPSAMPRHPSAMHICVLARLVPQKRIEDALTATALLRAEFPEVRLDIIGSGWWEGRLRAHCSSLDLDGAIKFHGKVSNEERDVLLGRAWVMLLPSVKEGWGLAVMEGAAQGCPAIAYSHAGGVTESIVDGETGLLADDLPHLVSLTKAVLTNPALRARLSEGATRRTREFSWDYATQQFERTLREAAFERVRDSSVRFED